MKKNRRFFSLTRNFRFPFFGGRRKRGNGNLGLLWRRKAGIVSSTLHPAATFSDICRKMGKMQKTYTMFHSSPTDAFNPPRPLNQRYCNRRNIYW